MSSGSTGKGDFIIVAGRGMDAAARGLEASRSFRTGSICGSSTPPPPATRIRRLPRFRAAGA